MTNFQPRNGILLINLPNATIPRRSTWSRSETLEVVDLTKTEDAHDQIDEKNIHSNRTKSKCFRCYLDKCVCSARKNLPLNRFDNAAFSIMTIKCPVCLDTLFDILQQEKCINSTICGHVFCETCIAAAVKSSRSCPSCRHVLSAANVYPLYLPIS